MTNGPIVVRIEKDPDTSLAAKLAPWRETLTLLIGGAWTLYLFVSTGHRQAQLDDEEKSLSAQLHRLDLVQKDIDLRYEAAAKQFAEDSTRMDIGNKQQSRIYSVDHRYQIDATLEILPASKPREYLAKLDFAVTNTGTTELQVAYVIVDQYLGNISLRDSGFAFINGPNGSQGDVSWRFLGYEGGVVETRVAELGTQPRDGRTYVLQANQLGVGLVKSGGHNPVDRDFEVRGGAADVVGFVIHIDIEQEGQAPSGTATRLWKPLLPTQSYGAAGIR